MEAVAKAHSQQACPPPWLPSTEASPSTSTHPHGDTYVEQAHPPAHTHGPGGASQVCEPSREKHSTSKALAAVKGDGFAYLHDVERLSGLRVHAHCENAVIEHLAAEAVQPALCSALLL